MIAGGLYGFFLVRCCRSGFAFKSFLSLKQDIGWGLEAADLLFTTAKNTSFRPIGKQCNDTCRPCFCISGTWISRVMNAIVPKINMESHIVDMGVYEN